MERTEVTAQHRWLHQLLGRWRSTWVSGPKGDVPPMAGTEEGRAIGELWVEVTGETDHGLHRMTLGYDPVAGQFVGTWLGSAMAYLWRYEGQLSEDGRSLLLFAEGPAMEGGGMARYRDVVTFVSPEARTLEGSVQQADGSWKPFVTVHHHRVGGEVVS